MKTNNPHVGTGYRPRNTIRRRVNTTNRQEELKRFSRNLRDAFADSDFPAVITLADAAGVDRTTLREAMGGKHLLNIISLTKICKALGVSLDEIMEGVVEY